MPLDFDRLPKFADLPVLADAPPDSSWGVFGDKDELGCLNFLTPDGIVAAARLVKKGKVFRLDARVGYAKPPLFGRPPFHHEIVNLSPTAHDDLLNAYNTQEGSQWDGLAHVGHVKHRKFYGGVTPEEIRTRQGRLSISSWADKFVGRGVLIDAMRYRAAEGRPIEPLTRDVVTLADLEGALKAQNTRIEPGSVLLVRTGWMEAYEAASEAEKRAMAPMDKLKSVGVEASRELVAWLWDHRIAAIGTDTPAAEPWPWGLTDPDALHHRAIPLIGLPLGEQFVLKPLARDCAGDGTYEFMVVAVPINLDSGIATPANTVVIK
ncbi:MAG: cyclase family protein [Stellaceae bacterium]